MLFPSKIDLCCALLLRAFAFVFPSMSGTFQCAGRIKEKSGCRLVWRWYFEGSVALENDRFFVWLRVIELASLLP